MSFFEVIFYGNSIILRRFILVHYSKSWIPHNCLKEISSIGSFTGVNPFVVDIYRLRKEIDAGLKIFKTFGTLNSACIFFLCPYSLRRILNDCKMDNQIRYPELEFQLFLEEPNVLIFVVPFF